MGPMSTCVTKGFQWQVASTRRHSHATTAAPKHTIQNHITLKSVHCFLGTRADQWSGPLADHQLPAGSHRSCCHATFYSLYPLIYIVGGAKAFGTFWILTALFYN